MRSVLVTVAGLLAACVTVDPGGDAPRARDLQAFAAAAGLYRAYLLGDEARLFAVADRVAEQFVNGALPVSEGPAGNALLRYWNARNERLSSSARAALYARVLGRPGTGAVETNANFDCLWWALVVIAQRGPEEDDKRWRRSLEASADALRADMVASVDISVVATARALEQQLDQAFALFQHTALGDAYRLERSRSPWRVIEQIAEIELGAALSVVRYRQLADAGTSIIDWLGRSAGELDERRDAGTFERFLDTARVWVRLGTGPATECLEAR